MISSTLPGGRELWVALGTIEKNHPESGFEVTNEFADYRLRTLEPACASREAALIDRSDEGPQLVQRDAVQHDFPSVYRINRWIVSKYNGYSQGTAARTIRLIPAVTNEVANDHATTAHRFQRLGREFGEPRALGRDRRATSSSVSGPEINPSRFGGGRSATPLSGAYCRVARWPC